MRISIWTKKMLLVSATAGSVAAAVAVVVLQLRPPAAMDAAATADNSTHVLSESLASESTEPRREEFDRFWELPLRRALYDPPPPRPEVKQAPPLRVELLGTILEAENSLAMLRSEKGSVEYKRVGDAVGPTDSPASIVEIRGDAVILKRAEERITLQVQSKELR